MQQTCSITKLIVSIHIVLLLLQACHRSVEGGDVAVDLLPRKIQNQVKFLVRRMNDPVRCGCVHSRKFVDQCNKTMIEFCGNVPKFGKDIARRNGFYYGLGLDVIEDSISNDNSSSVSVNKVLSARTAKKKQNVLLAETIDDLRESLDELRQELKLLREFQSQMFLGRNEEGTSTPYSESPMIKVNRRRERFDNIAKSVEVWAEKLLFEEDEDHGWSVVHCNKMFKNKFNPDDTIQCFLKWMPDSREKGPDVEFLDDGDFPCIKVYATLDASYEQVCHYLANESNLPEYNDLVVKNRDVEEIDSHSKICWGQSPQILFIKPRDFVTFCHHRWKKDGTQIVVNQAVEHTSMPGTLKEEKGKACRAYAIRGANIIWRDPNDPNKTKYAMLAHAHPGGGLPHWAMKSAINALAPIEPFKLFHKIEKGAQAIQPPPPTTFTSTLKGRSVRPGGLSQLGYACFWPEGGGLTEERVDGASEAEDSSEDQSQDVLVGN